MRKTPVRKIKLDLSAPNIFSPVYIPVINDRNRYILMYGGRDSAKSYTAAQKVVKTVVQESYCKAVCLRKVFSDIKDSQFDTIWSVIESWNLTPYFKYTKSPLEITCTLNGNKILARGLDKPAKLKSIKDPTLVWAEEADEIGLKEFIKSDTSIRGPAGSLFQFILTFNPENQKGWINDYFFPPPNSYERPDGRFNYVESTKANTTILHTTYLDNIYCPIERGQMYEALATLADENYYKVYCLGLWGNALRSLIFENINYVDKFPDESEWKKVFYGLDFGFTNDPTALVKVVLAHGELWIENLIYKPGLTNIINEKTPNQPTIEEEFRKLGFHYKPHKIWADGAEPKSIQDLKNCGFDINAADKGKDSVKNGIDVIKRYKINVVGSPHLKKELKSYKWKEDKEGNLLNEPIDAWNHAIDALRYACYMELDNENRCGFDLLAGSGSDYD